VHVVFHRADPTAAWGRVACFDQAMAASTPIRRLAPPLAALVALALAAGADAGKEPPRPDLSTSGNDSELVRAVPITTTAGATERTVVSLGPDQLPRLAAGDRLRTSAEVQVSTTCVARSERCVGRRYDFNPTIRGRVVLAAGPEPTDASIPLSETKQVLCKQRRPNRNHHCTLAFPNVELPILDPGSLPCAANACYANLIVGASSKRAQRGNRVVLGADRPDGSVTQDKARLNVVHAPGELAPPTELAGSELVNSTLPLTEGKKEKRRVVHSLPIPVPRKGDVLAFDGGYLASIRQLPFNTFISSRVIVAETPTSTDPTGVARSAVQLRGDATEANGFNCTQGPSGYPTPCTSVKAGAIRITRDALDSAGAPATLYLNLVASAKPLLPKAVKGTQLVDIAATTGLHYFRYPGG
jgi:hypothetical protein